MGANTHRTMSNHETSARTAFARGARNGLPFIVVAGPFGMLFGVVATEAGLNLSEVMGFSVLVIAGAAQVTAVQMLAENASVILTVLAAVAVNLRMAMYSASLQPHLGAAPLWQRALVAYVSFDQTYAASILEYETNPNQSVAEKAAYFLGVSAPVVPVWILASLTGGLVGSTIPDWLALDFALPIMFLALIAPMLRTLAQVSAVVVSVGVALLTAGLPSGTGLLLAAGLAMVTGAAVEARVEGKAA